MNPWLPGPHRTHVQGSKGHSAQRSRAASSRRSTRALRGLGYEAGRRALSPDQQPSLQAKSKLRDGLSPQRSEALELISQLIGPSVDDPRHDTARIYDAPEGYLLVVHPSRWPRQLAKIGGEHRFQNVKGGGRVHSLVLPSALRAAIDSQGLAIFPPVVPQVYLPVLQEECGLQAEPMQEAEFAERESKHRERVREKMGRRDAVTASRRTSNQAKERRDIMRYEAMKAESCNHNPLSALRHLNPLPSCDPRSDEGYIDCVKELGTAQAGTLLEQGLKKVTTLIPLVQVLRDAGGPHDLDDLVEMLTLKEKYGERVSSLECPIRPRLNRFELMKRGGRPLGKAEDDMNGDLRAREADVRKK